MRHTRRPETRIFVFPYCSAIINGWGSHYNTCSVLLKTYTSQLDNCLKSYSSNNGYSRGPWLSAIPLWLAWRSTYFSTLSGSLLQDNTPCFQWTLFLQSVRRGLLLLGNEFWKKSCLTKLYQLRKCDSRDGKFYLNVTYFFRRETTFEICIQPCW